MIELRREPSDGHEAARLSCYHISRFLYFQKYGNTGKNANPKVVDISNF